MAQKQFNQFGLRRDLNLSDLPSATAALNNILSNPTMLGSEESFTTTDLEPIQGIYITNITANTFNSLNGVTVAFTIIENGIVDNSSNPKVYKPLIKIKNRLDAAYFSTGEPFFFGGDGPNARYYDNSEIVRDAEAYSNTTDVLSNYRIGDVVSYDQQLWRRVKLTSVQVPGAGDQWDLIGPYTDLFFDDEIDSDGNIVTLTDNFWERGQFVYSEKLQSSFLSLFGGTNWQGFYKPTVSGTTTFLLNTTGNTIFKFQDPASQSFQAVRYGAPSTTALDFFNTSTSTNTRYNLNQIQELLAIYNDPTRQLVQVELMDLMKLKHGDLIYLDVQEGQVPAQRYRIIHPWEYDEVSEIPLFFIEVTEEFNKLNLDSSTLDTAVGGYIWALSPGTFTSLAGSNNTPAGLKAVVRYTPYDRKNLKTYLNSYRHRIDIDLSAGNTITGATTFTVSDEVYQNIMINDFVYDYRISDVDSSQGVRRYIVTNCSSSGGVNTVTVEIDTDYTQFSATYNNDQQYYYRIEGETLVADFVSTASDGPNSIASLKLASGSATGQITYYLDGVGISGAGTHSYTTPGSTTYNYNSSRAYYVLTPNTTMTFDFTFKGCSGGGSNAGRGAKITGQVTLVAGNKYTIVSGGVGSPTRYPPQYGGGGAEGQAGSLLGGGGGGFTGLFLGDETQISQLTALVVAGGGGGAASDGKAGGNAGGASGPGTGNNGQNGSGGSAGTGGTLTSAGTTTWISGGLTAEYEAGALQGGDGENSAGNNVANGGGGGGAGYFGGGGGRGDVNLSPGPSGGGGGSSYINTAIVSSYTIETASGLGNTAITKTYTTGGLNRSLSVLNSFNKLIHVARLGELTTRQRYITIEQYLDRYVDYTFDWTFFMKDEDVAANTTNKAWILRQRTETSGGYGSVSYKHLYEKDYEFYQIGDFKTFLDNSVLSGGTSREDGVDQRAFGKPQLIDPGDQYNTLYSLLPIKSIYSPQENWNNVALSRTGSISSDSRLLSLNNGTDIQIGNYVVRDTTNGFLSGEQIDYGTRIINILPESNSVVLNKEAITPFSNQNLWILNHRGFVATGTLNWDGARHYLQMDSRRVSDIKSGQILVFKDSPSTQTYVRITRVDLDPNDDTIVYVNIDSQNPYPSSNGGQIAVYHDKGIDITKPLQSFCVGTACAQNNYQGDGINKTKYIAVRVFNGGPSPSPGIDIRWTEGSLTGAYGNSTTVAPGTSSNPSRAVFTPTQNFINQSFTNWGNGPSIAWWADADTGFSYPNQATRVGLQYNASGRKRYGGSHIYSKIAGSSLASAINEKLGPGNTFPYNSYVPIGVLEGFIRVDGDIWNNTAIEGSERFYVVIRLATDLSSVPQPDNGYNPVWQDGTLSSDGQTQLPVKIDLTEFPSSAFNMTKYAFPTQQDNMLPYGGTVASVSNIQNVYTTYNNGITDNADRSWQATANITLTQSEAQTWFFNSTSLAQDDGNGNITYVMKTGTWFKTYSTTGKLLYFDTFESILDTENLISYRPDFNDPATPIIDDISFADDPELINLFNNDGPTQVLSNTYTDQFRFMHYRNKVYQIVPTSLDAERVFPGIRMIDPNAQTTGVLNHLENTTNALSVYTFANTTENKELCCPPLDTSPPFDSSEIGLSTTTSNPDFHVDGLINVRSISATHPESKIFGIPSNITNANLPVNQKLEIVFGGVKYDLLIGNSKPF